jgi:hypothetical protein
VATSRTVATDLAFLRLLQYRCSSLTAPALAHLWARSQHPLWHISGLAHSTRSGAALGSLTAPALEHLWARSQHPLWHISGPAHSTRSGTSQRWARSQHPLWCSSGLARGSNYSAAETGLSFLWASGCLFVGLSVCLSVSSLCNKPSLTAATGLAFLWASGCLFVWLAVCLFVCLSVCLSVSSL